MSQHWKMVSVALGAMVTGSLIAGAVLSLPQGVRTSDAYAQQVDTARAAQANLQAANDLSVAFRNVSEAMRPSVVSVRSTKKARVMQGGRGGDFDDLPPQIRRFFEEDGFGPFGGMPRGNMQVPEQSGIGSGVIIDASGHILTNNHVVEGADLLRVRLSDGRDFEAKVIGTDPETDIAVLKIEAGEVQPAVLGDSDAMQVGDWVLAMGSPFELEQTVTAGIISAKNRVQGIVGRGQFGGFEDFIQTDAAINPGNSGGPLVNLRGEVIGINTAIVSRSGGYNGIGFAIPTMLARFVVDSILETGSVRRGFLGAEGGAIPQEMMDKLQLSSRSGAYVERVVPGQPADKGGLRGGDIVQSFNGRKVRDWFQFRNFIASQRPGATVDLEVLREGQLVKLKLTLGERTDELLAQMGGGEAAGVFLDARVQPLTADSAKQMGFDGIESGLLVTQVSRNSEEESGLQAGDVITAAQGQPVKSLAELQQALQAARSDGRALRLTVQRGAGQELVLIE